MLSLGTEALTAKPDGHGTPKMPVDGHVWRCRAGRGRSKRGPRLLELFGDGHEGYSAPESAPASCLSGECRLIEFLILALRVNGIDSIATGHWTIEFRAVFSMVRKGIRKMTTYHTQGDGR